MNQDKKSEMIEILKAERLELLTQRQESRLHLNELNSVLKAFGVKFGKGKGRPPGSKNKAKEVDVERDPSPAVEYDGRYV